MPAPGAPPLTVIADLASSLLMGLVAPVMYQFVLQHAPKISIGALSWQLPCRLMDAVMPDWWISLGWWRFTYTEASSA